jgi:hypothetical protein
MSTLCSGRRSSGTAISDSGSGSNGSGRPKEGSLQGGNGNDQISHTSSLTSTLPSLVNIEQNKKMILDTALTGTINDVIFPRKQFIVLERELHVEGKLAKRVLMEIHRDAEDWEDMREMVRKKLNRRRNNAQSLVRKSLKSKCCVGTCVCRL